MKVWVDHMVDHFSTYIYQKRGFYYVSRRVPKDVQLRHGKQRIVLALNTRSYAKSLKYSQVICQPGERLPEIERYPNSYSHVFGMNLCHHIKVLWPCSNVCSGWD